MSKTMKDVIPGYHLCALMWISIMSTQLSNSHTLWDICCIQFATDHRCQYDDRQTSNCIPSHTHHCPAPVVWTYQGEGKHTKDTISLKSVRTLSQRTRPGPRQDVLRGGERNEEHLKLVPAACVYVCDCLCLWVDCVCVCLGVFVFVCLCVCVYVWVGVCEKKREW